MLSESLEKPCRLWITLEERLAEGKEFARGGCLDDRFGVLLYCQSSALSGSVMNLHAHPATLLLSA